MRSYIYDIIHNNRLNRQSSMFYNWFIMFVAVLSVVPMAFRDNASPLLRSMESVTVYILFFDYILRWMTHDFRMKNHSAWAFLIYPFSPLALMDIAGILPTLGLLPAGFMILRVFRLVKLLQYSKSCRHIINVFRNQGKTLASVFIIALAYIFVSAMVMFVNEPAENFPTFFDALYWATTALTTVGYGDIYPTSQIGQLISMVSSFFGIAIIALPAGVVTAGFMDELNNNINDAEKEGGNDEKQDG